MFQSSGDLVQMQSHLEFFLLPAMVDSQAGRLPLKGSLFSAMAESHINHFIILEGID
jgi:hypothetical protein